MTKQMAAPDLKILLIGATGQLGGDLIRNNPGYEFIAPDRQELDLARPAEAARSSGKRARSAAAWAARAKREPVLASAIFS